MDYENPRHGSWCVCNVVFAEKLRVTHGVNVCVRKSQYGTLHNFRVYLNLWITYTRQFSYDQISISLLLIICYLLNLLVLKPTKSLTFGALLIILFMLLSEKNLGIYLAAVVGSVC